MSTRAQYWAGVAWGMTRRHAYLFDPDNRLLERHSDDVGVACQPADYADALAGLLARWPQIVTDSDVYLTGMVGSRHGWLETPYLPVPVALEQIRPHLMRAPFAAARAWIVPGLSDDTGPDVMRGDETLALGAWRLGAGDGCYVMPGTHAKWLCIDAGRITCSHTFMTGELFSLLQRQGTLASLLLPADDQSGIDIESFDAGLATAAQGRTLSHALFSLRALILRHRLSAELGPSWLSGLLIGSEFTDAGVRPLLAGGVIHIVGTSPLAALYARAAHKQGVEARVINADDAFVAALAALRGQL
ncbi:MAG: 2-dehydro-3-deoxygalactonokinase [Rhodocyclaceae bacterium]